MKFLRVGGSNLSHSHTNLDVSCFVVVGVGLEKTQLFKIGLRSGEFGGQVAVQNTTVESHEQCERGHHLAQRPIPNIG